MDIVERVARDLVGVGGIFDPDEIMPNDGPRWKYYVPLARAALAAMLEAVGEPEGWKYQSPELPLTNGMAKTVRVEPLPDGWTETPLYSLAALREEG